MVFRKIISNSYDQNKTKSEKKTIYLGLSILENSQKVMHEFRYDHIKQKHQEKTNLI